MSILTKAELEAIRKRAEAATPGPWFNSELLYVVNNIKGDSMEWTADFIAETENEKDAEFIAHAREDIPKLLEYINELKAELSRLCPIADFDTITTLKTEIAYRDECIAELKVEIERLQQEKDEWYEKYMRSDATISLQYSQLQEANEKIQRYEKALKAYGDEKGVIILKALEEPE